MILTSHDVDWQLNYKIKYLFLLHIHVSFKVLVKQAIRLKQFFLAFKLLHLTVRKIATIKPRYLTWIIQGS